MQQQVGGDHLVDAVGGIEALHRLEAVDGPGLTGDPADRAAPGRR